MSLLYEMSKLPTFAQQRILVVDKSQKKDNDRTWSFWAPEGLEYKSITTKSWKKSAIYERPGHKIDIQFEEFEYHTIYGIDFYNYIFSRLSAFENITFLTQGISKVEQGKLTLENNQIYTGKSIINSIFKKEELPKAKTDVFMWQHFYGWFVKFKEDILDDSEFVMMDYRKCDLDSTNFFYQLPFSKNEVLIEFTEFSMRDYTEAEIEEKITTYIAENFPGKKYTVERKERNAIPMTDHKVSPTPTKGIYNIGTIAGYVKSSSGYAFMRTIEKTKKLAAQVLDHKTENQKTTFYAFLLELFDHTLITILSKKSLQGYQVYPGLFKNQSGDFVIRFLHERIKIPELLKIMWPMPRKFLFARVFIRSFFKKIT